MKRLLILILFIIVTSFTTQDKTLFQSFSMSNSLSSSTREFDNWSSSSILIEINGNVIRILSNNILTLHINSKNVSNNILSFTGMDSDGDIFSGRLYQITDNIYRIEVYYTFGAFSYKLRKI